MSQGIVYLILGFFLLYSGFHIRHRLQQKLEQCPSQVEAMITEEKAKKDVSGQINYTRVYVYWVEGKQYQAEGPSPYLRRKHFIVGTKAPIHYNPQHPEQYITFNLNGRRRMYILFWLIGLLFCWSGFDRLPPEKEGNAL